METKEGREDELRLLIADDYPAETRKTKRAKKEMKKEVRAQVKEIEKAIDEA